MIKVVIAIALSMLGITLVDILIWQRIFEVNQLWQYDAAYHAGWFTLRNLLIPAGGLLLWPRGKLAVVYGSFLWLFTRNGLGDILYYWLDGRALPASLPWLNQAEWVIFKPIDSPIRLIAGVLVWFGVWLIVMRGVWLSAAELRAECRQSGKSQAEVGHRKRGEANRAGIGRPNRKDRSGLAG